MTKIKKAVLSSTAVSFTLTVVFSVITIISKNSVCYSLAITFGTIFYHFAMRLAVGEIIPSNFNCNNFWFKEKSFERNLYKLLKVKKWKGKVPSYNPQSALIRNTDLSDTVNTMCRNEVIHEVIALLSFVPIVFSLVFGAISVFVITSVIACFLDLIFVVLQRYNRPRVLKLIKKCRHIKINR